MKWNSIHRRWSMRKFKIDTIRAEDGIVFIEGYQLGAERATSSFFEIEPLLFDSDICDDGWLAIGLSLAAKCSRPPFVPLEGDEFLFADGISGYLANDDDIGNEPYGLRIINDTEVSK